MIDDTLIQSKIRDEFRWDPRLRDAEIAIGVKDNVASLSGSVSSNAVKQAAARAAERIGGVRAVANGILVIPRGPHERTDTELAHAVLNAFAAYAPVQTQDVRARFDKGWVVLEGTVDQAYQMDEAEWIAQGIVGVRGVTNLIEVVNRVAAESVAAGIREALARHTIEDASGIEVEPHGDMVILRGNVQSFAERSLAEQAARNSGIVEIQNEILVREMPANWHA